MFTAGLVALVAAPFALAQGGGGAFLVGTSYLVIVMITL